MSEFIKKYDLLNKVIALSLAVILWAVVVNIKNPIITVGYQDILVNYVSLDMVEDDEYELVIISDEYPIVDIKLRGVRAEIAQVSESNIDISSDLSHIKEPGVYEVPYSVKLPFSDMEVSNKNPEYLSVTIDYIQTKNIPVEVELTGTPSLNYSYESVEVQSYVVISGPSTEVGLINKAYVEVDVDGAYSDISVIEEVTLFDKTGQVVVSDNIKQSDYTLSVSMPVYKISSVPLEVNLVYGDIVSPKAIKDYTINTLRVYIKGRPDDVNEITSINIGDLYVDDTQFGKSEFVFALPYLANINYASQGEHTATVTVEFTDYTIKTFDISNFVFDEKYSEIEIFDEFITVEIAGSEADFEVLDEEEIYIELEIDPEIIEEMRKGEDRLPSGVYEFVGIVNINSESEFDIIGEYIIVVNVAGEE